MHNVHDYLNAALSLSNIAEMLREAAVLDETQKVTVCAELLWIHRFVERQIQELRE